MKKILLILSMILCIFLALVSCGDEELKETKAPQEPSSATEKGVQVSKDEWVDAFKFRGVNNLSVNYDIVDESHGMAYQGTIKYNGSNTYTCENEIYLFESESYTDREEIWSISWEPLEDNDLFFWNNGDYRFGQAIFEELSNYLDYNYNGFVYNNEDGSYFYTANLTSEAIEFNFVREITISFGENKKFSKIGFVNKYNDGTTISFAYDFNYSCDDISIPVDRVQSSINEMLNLEGVMFGAFDEFQGEPVWHNTIDPNLLSFLLSLDIDNTIQLHIFNFEQRESSTIDMSGNAFILANGDISVESTATIYGTKLSYSGIIVSFCDDYCIDSIDFFSSNGKTIFSVDVEMP